MASMEKTPVMLLQELAVKAKAVPIYELIHSEEGTHKNTFQVRVTVFNRSAVGIHSTKQGAKHNAAAELLKLIPKNVISTNNIDETKTPISLLLEYAEQNTDTLAEYQLIFSKRDIHGTYYEYEVTLLDEKGIGGGRRKQLARHRAAADLLKRLENNNVSQDNNFRNISGVDSLNSETSKLNRPINKEWSVSSDSSDSPAEDDNFYEDNHEISIFAKQVCPVNNVVYPEQNYSKVEVTSKDPAETKSFEYNKKKLPASINQKCATKNIYARHKQSYSNEQVQTGNSYIAKTSVKEKIDNRKYKGILKDSAEALISSLSLNRSSYNDIKEEEIPISMQQNNINSTTGAHKKSYQVNNQSPISMEQKCIVKNNIIPDVEHKNSVEASDCNKFIQFKLASIDCEGFTYACVSSSVYIRGTSHSKKVAKQIAAVKMLERLMDTIAELTKSKLKLTEDNKELCIKRFTEIVNSNFNFKN